MQEFVVHARDRRSGRRSVRLGCELVRTSDWSIVGTRALDLSSEGMQILAQDDAAVGDDMQVFFRVPFTGIWVLSEAKVTRVVRGLRRGDEGRAYGIKFAELHEDARHALNHAIGRFPPVVPRRATRVDYAATVRLIGRT